MPLWTPCSRVTYVVELISGVIASIAPLWHTLVIQRNNSSINHTFNVTAFVLHSQRARFSRLECQIMALVKFNNTQDKGMPLVITKATNADPSGYSWVSSWPTVNGLDRVRYMAHCPDEMLGCLRIDKKSMLVHKFLNEQNNGEDRYERGRVFFHKSIVNYKDLCKPGWCSRSISRIFPLNTIQDKYL
jgi:hypothetical protein